MLTVHHLDYSRSTRVLWLLEELGVRHEVVRYRRAVGGPAPASLSLIHPLGKSPVLEDGDLVLAESSAILRYLDLAYGGSRFTPAGPHARAVHDEWLDFVEGGVATPLFVLLIAGDGLPDGLRDSFSTQLERAWGHLANTVGDAGFLFGDDPTLAGIQMSYPLAVASALGRLGSWPSLEAYLGRMNARPALCRALAAGGPMA